MPGILFVCTANLYRSPLAAAFLRRRLELDGQSDEWLVESAGTWATPGQPVHPALAAAVGPLGLDLREHRSRLADADLLARHDLVAVMERGHREALSLEFPSIREKLLLLSGLADGLEYDIPDPAASGVSMQDLASQMQRLIDRAYPALCQLAYARGLIQLPPRPHINVTL